MAARWFDEALDMHLDVSRYPEGSLARRNAEAFNEEYERGRDRWSPSDFVAPVRGLADPDPNPMPRIHLWSRRRAA